jgi:DNA-binding protein HU-beta
MNRSELVAAIAAHTGQSQTSVNAVLDALFTTVAGEVAKGNKVTIPGWVAFDRTNRAARQGRNPQTATIQIAASKSVKVSAGSKLKAAVK